MHDTNKKFKIELLGMARSVFYMVCRVVARKNSISLPCKLGVIYIYIMENNEVGITCSSSFYISNTKFNHRPLISSENESWK